MGKKSKNKQKDDGIIEKNIDFEEARNIKQMIGNMPKAVSIGSVWYIISMKWITKWQTHVGFNQMLEETKEAALDFGPHPDKIDNQDILIGEGKTGILKELSAKEAWANQQLKPNLKEGEDYMLVDSAIHSEWQTKYGEIIEIKRFGIKDEDGEAVVEIYLRQVLILPLPNKSLFKLYKDDVQAQPIYLSKCSTMEDLQKKICRLLSSYIYLVLRDKSIMVSKVRLWKSNEELSALKDVDYKYQNYTHVKVDASILNLKKDQQSKKIYEVDFSDQDIIIVELPKKGDFVLQPKGQEDEENKQDFEDPLNNQGLEDLKQNQVSLAHINALNLENIFKKGSRKGITGLQNLGNTCFMNSGLQCLSATVELTKYFLFDIYKRDINTDNPLGLGGRLAQAYAGLVQDLWIGKDSKTAPYDLKRVLGKRVARFSGYGQQDACELLNFVLDLIHEDLNRVKKKPYVEMPDDEGQPDAEMSAIYWKGFLARNQSIIVDLMYGQLKSTVQCLDCGNISVAFDPFLTISLPISKPTLFHVALVPYELFQVQKSDSSSEDDDPDYRSDKVQSILKQFVFNFKVDAKTTVGDLKQQILDKVAVIGGRQILASNLVLTISKWGEVTQAFSDNDLVESIDQSGTMKTHFIEKMIKPIEDDEKLTEINFSKCTLSKKGVFHQQNLISSAIPRYQTFNMNDTIIDIKKKIWLRISPAFVNIVPDEVTDELINSVIMLHIKDNTPYVEGRRNTQSKAKCEFCGRNHSMRDDICDVRSKEYKNGNNWDNGSQKLTLEDLYSQLRSKRDIKLEVMINIASKPNFQAFAANFKVHSSANKSAEAKQKDNITLESCFKEFSTEELLSGDDQWYCKQCKEHRDIHKKLELYKIPKILMVQIKRFQTKKSANSGKSGMFNLAYAQICQQEKVDEPVDFPIEGLDIAEFVKSDVNADGVSTVYDLYAITNHFGSLNGGHYTAYAKGIDGNWYDFNDSHVSSAGNRIKSSAAYLLFYRRRDLPADSQIDTAESQKDEERKEVDSAYIYELD